LTSVVDLDSPIF